MVPTEELERLKSNQPPSRNIFEHPDVSKVKELDRNMKEILSSDTLSDYDKVVLHSQNLIQYMDKFKDALRVSKTDALLGKSMSHETREEKIYDDKMEESKNNSISGATETIAPDELVSELPKTYRGKALKTLNHLLLRSGFKWDENRVVSYNGK